MSDISRRVLVADDDELSRWLIAEQLRQVGFVAELAGSGREALDRWRGGSFDLLLTDLHMPVMNGCDLAAALREEEGPGERLPIIALTANDHDAERCLAAGMDGYLTKPVALSVLRTTLERWLAAPAAPEGG